MKCIYTETLPPKLRLWHGRCYQRQPWTRPCYMHGHVHTRPNRIGATACSECSCSPRANDLRYLNLKVSSLTGLAAEQDVTS